METGFKFSKGETVYISSFLTETLTSLKLVPEMKKCSKGPYTIADHFLFNGKNIYSFTEKQAGFSFFWLEEWLVPSAKIQDIDPEEILNIIEEK